MEDGFKRIRVHPKVSFTEFTSLNALKIKIVVFNTLCLLVVGGFFLRHFSSSDQKLKYVGEF